MLIAAAVVVGILAAMSVSAIVSILSIAVGNQGAKAIDRKSKVRRFFGGFFATAGVIGLFASPLIGLFVGISTGLFIAGV